MVSWIKISTHFQSVDPLLATLIKTPIVLSVSNNPFIDLVESIISQQLSIKAADTIFLRLKAFGPITPTHILDLPEKTFRSAGISGSKTLYIKNVARAKINFEKLHALSDEDVIAELVHIKGIGRWTAEMFCMFSLAREDIFSFGDAGLQRAIQNLYQTKSQKRIMNISNKWKPYRTYAARLLWNSLDNT